MSAEIGFGIELDLGGKLDEMHHTLKQPHKLAKPNRKPVGVAGNSGPSATSPLLLQLPQYPSVDYTWEIIQAGLFGPDAHTDLVTAVGNPMQLGATGIASYNNNAYGINVNIAGGTVTAVSVNGSLVTGVTSGTVFVPAGGSLSVTYSVAPTLTSSNVVGPTGFVAAAPIVNVIADVFTGTSVDPNFVDLSAAKISSMFTGSIYNLGHKKIWVQPGEQVYALVYGLQANVSVEFIIMVDEWKWRDQMASTI